MPGSGQKRERQCHPLCCNDCSADQARASKNQLKVVFVFFHQPGLIGDPLRQPVGFEFTFHDWLVAPNLGVGKSTTKGSQKRQKRGPLFCLGTVSCLCLPRAGGSGEQIENVLVDDWMDG